MDIGSAEKPRLVKSVCSKDSPKMDMGHVGTAWCVGVWEKKQMGKNQFDTFLTVSFHIHPSSLRVSQVLSGFAAASRLDF